MQIELVKTFSIDVAHRRRAGDSLHGHSLSIDVVCRGETAPPLDWLIDYAEIKAAFEPVKSRLDHRDLNDVLGRDAVSLADVEAWAYNQLEGRIPCLTHVHAAIEGDGGFLPQAVGPNSGLNYPARTRFTFEAAHFLPHLPEDHKCRRVHGHSFRVEAAAETDGLPAMLQAIHGRLDHGCLNDVPGLENPTSENLSRWIWDALATAGCQGLQCVIVQENCMARCVYRGG